MVSAGTRMTKRQNHAFAGVSQWPADRR